MLSTDGLYSLEGQALPSSSCGCMSLGRTVTAASCILLLSVLAQHPDCLCVQLARRGALLAACYDTEGLSWER